MVVNQNKHIKKKIMKNSVVRQIKTKEDVKAFFQKKMDDKKAWMDFVRKGRSSELEKREIKVATLDKVFKV